MLGETIISPARVSGGSPAMQAEPFHASSLFFFFILFYFFSLALHPLLKKWDVSALAHLAVDKSLC